MTDQTTWNQVDEYLGGKLLGSDAALEEFFAVGAEAFFVAPEDLEPEEPELYRLLAEFFRQDPARDKRNGGPEAPVAADRSGG